MPRRFGAGGFMNPPAKIIIEISTDVRKELEYLVELHQRYGAPMPVTSLEALIGYVREGSAFSDNFSVLE
jgi:hypothetical protein